MERKRKLIVAKVAVVMGTIPLLIWGYQTGPDRPATGAPGEQTCAQAQCHVAAGTPNGAGSITVTFPAGLVYTPGVKQHVVISMSHPTARVWGFQMSARVASAQTTNAGSFTSTDRTTAVLCAASATDLNGTIIDFPASQACPPNKPLAFIEHAFSPKPLSQTFEFDWTPPATNVGDVRFFLAANAANGNQHEDGDQIYSMTVTLSPGATNVPAIEFNGVQNGASFEPGVVPNSWLTIKGANLSSTVSTWDKLIVDGRLPTELEGVTVNVGNKPAYISYVSPTQINVLAPDAAIGSVAVNVRNSLGASTAATATSSRFMPAFFLWPNKQAVATHLDGTWAVKNGTFQNQPPTAVPAKPDEIIVLWGTGFGPTNPAAPVGSVALPGVLYTVANPVTVTVGGTPADFIGAALSGGFAGLYQIAIRIPASAPNGDLPVVATVSGAQSPTGVTITVQR